RGKGRTELRQQADYRRRPAESRSTPFPSESPLKLPQVPCRRIHTTVTRMRSKTYDLALISTWPHRGKPPSLRGELSFPRLLRSANEARSRLLNRHPSSAPESWTLLD